MRLTITLQQVVGSGLTCLSVIRQAVAKYPAFEWGRVHRILPDEYTAAVAIFGLVKNNAYYAWGDMGVASAKRYATFAWTCSELLKYSAGALTRNSCYYTSGFMKKKKSALEKIKRKCGYGICF